MIIYDQRHQPVWGAGSNHAGAVRGPNERLVFQGGPASDGWPRWTSKRSDCENFEWTERKEFVPEEFYVTCRGEVLKFHAGNVVIWDQTSSRFGRPDPTPPATTTVPMLGWSSTVARAVTAIWWSMTTPAKPPGPPT
ncbi:MAG TPA: hypothetical protein VF062_08215 [Candidatus Limnocylindrales bacterium]